jgi:hypothetical protein
MGCHAGIGNRNHHLPLLRPIRHQADYSAKQRKTGGSDNIFPYWASTDILKDLDDNKFDYDDDEVNDVEHEDDIYLEPSNIHIKKLKEMNAIENIV